MPGASGQIKFDKRLSLTLSLVIQDSFQQRCEKNPQIIGSKLEYKGFTNLGLYRCTRGVLKS